MNMGAGIFERLDDLRSPWQWAQELAAMARECAGEGRLDHAHRLWAVAIAIAREGEQDIDCSSVLWEISEDLALAGAWRQADEVALAIRNAGKRRRALDNLAALKAGARGAFQRLRDARSLSP
jgi:hypothetical protein